MMIIQLIAEQGVMHVPTETKPARNDALQNVVCSGLVYFSAVKISYWPMELVLQ